MAWSSVFPVSHSDVLFPFPVFVSVIFYVIGRFLVGRGGWGLNVYWFSGL